MVESTHDVTIGDRNVVKRYRSWQRGEADREWRGLSLLHRFSPGLAPEPLDFRREDGVPVIVMSRVPGVALGAVPLQADQVAEVAAAMRSLYEAVPPAHAGGIPERISGPTQMITELRSWNRGPRDPGSELVQSALTAATRWVDGADVTGLMGPLAQRVFTQGDGNLGNFIWDGTRCAVVDFEDSGMSDSAYEVADLIEHVSVWLRGLVDGDELVRHLGFGPAQLQRLLQFRRLLCLFWLLMLMPGNPGHARNPVGSAERQAQRMQHLLDTRSVR